MTEVIFWSQSIRLMSMKPFISMSLAFSFVVRLTVVDEDCGNLRVFCVCVCETSSIEGGEWIKLFFFFIFSRDNTGNFLFSLSTTERNRILCL